MRMAATLVEVRTRRCGLGRSQDGGATWQRLAVSPSPAAYPFCFAPAGGIAQASVAFGRNGTLYYAMLGWSDSDGDARSVLVARSGDLGATWRTTVVDDARGRSTTGEPERNRPPSLVVDARSSDDDVVHVAFSGDAGAVVLAVSTDGGRSFSTPRDVAGDSTAAARTVGGLAVDRAGRVYAVWASNAGRVVLGRSADAGRSFTVAPIASGASDDADAAAAGTPRVAWSAAGGGEHGTLHVVFDREAHVMYTRSTDGGRQWSEAQVLDDHAAGARLPTIGATSGGRVDVAWWDSRSHSAGNDVYYASSADGGRSWSTNVRITDRVVDRTIGSWPNADVNGPPGLASTRAAAVLAWDDPRNGNPLSQAQDVYSAVVRYPVPEPGAMAAISSGVAGGVAGLATGLILLGAALDAKGGRFRRRPAVGGRNRLGVGW